MSTKRSASTSPVATKKAKTETTPNTPKDGGPRELTKGAKWMIAQIDKMQWHHTACLKAVTAIIQHRTYAKQLRTRNPQIPPALIRRLQSHWEAYECIRRHVEWYMTQNALHASTPSRPPPPTTSPLASTLTPLTSIQTQDLPKASPIALSTSMMAYDNPPADPSSSIAPIPNAGIPSIPGPKPIPAFAQTSDPLNFGDGQLDLSSLGVDELSAFLNGSNDTNPFGDGSADDFISSLFSDTGTADMNQAETDRLLSSLSQPSGQVSAGGGGDFNFDFGATDGGEMDMSQLTALFEANDGPTTSEPAPPLLQSTNPVATTTNATAQPPIGQPAPAANKAGEGAQVEADGGHKKRPSIGVGSANPSETPQAKPTETPAVETVAANQSNIAVQPDAQPTQAQSALDQAMANIGDGQDYDLSNIDLDDFNFGEIPNVEGDEFESLFAEFK